MKREGHIFERICEPENIRTAMWKASLGKRDRPQVRRVLDRADHYARLVQTMLLEQSFTPTPPKERRIFDGPSGKERVICKPAFFPDQVIHWALMLQLQPVLMRGMYRWNCGSVPGRGTSDAQKALRRWLDKDPRRTKYCLKMDISKFYPSVKADPLKGYFRRKLKDNRTLWLIDQIIDSADGLPIGYYTSQWFANAFLEDLDHFIKQVLRVPYALRYVDDLVLLGPNKRKLHRARMEIEAFLEAKGLKLKGDWQVFPIRARAIDFVGMRFYRDHTTLRKRNALRIRRRLRRIRRKRGLSLRDAAAVISYWGWVKRTDSFRFYNKYMRPVVPVATARRVISSGVRRSQTGRDRRGGQGGQKPGQVRGL